MDGFILPGKMKQGLLAWSVYNLVHKPREGIGPVWVANPGSNQAASEHNPNLSVSRPDKTNDRKRRQGLAQVVQGNPDHIR
jgi:hypothetical protein